ncbi:MAG: DHA2 family efflux MFS transporter permease subunit [Actinomycetota bacterium]|nr:DHA2 family efflux MFS transporter permease subunit [Actinomycetota bacterium]
MGQRTIHERRWLILSTLVLSLLVVVLDNTILNVALKTIQEDLRATQSELAWAVNAYTLVFAGLLFTYGVLGDRFGRRLALLVGLVLFALASLLAAFSTSPEALIASRAFMGIGAAAVMPSTLSIISNVFEAEERAKAIGIWAGFVGLAVAVGPITGGLLLERFWWGSVFLVNVPVVLVAIAAIVWIVPESKDPDPQRVDPAGVVLSIVGLVLLVFGIIQGGESGQWGSAAALGPMIGGVAVLALFVALQRRTASPMLDVTLFRNPAFSAACGAVTLVMFSLFGTVFYVTFYLQYARALSPLEAGLTFLPVAAAMSLFAPRSAKLVRTYGPKAVCAVGLVLLTLSFSGYLFLGAETPIAVLVVLLFLQGAGMANVIAPATESIMSTVPRERAGAGSAVNTTVRQVGGALGVAVLGSILSASYRAGITPSLDAAALDGLSRDARELAAESIGGTQLVAEQLPAAAADALVAAGTRAFIDAMHITALGSALVAALGVLVVLRWLPGRPGEIDLVAAEREHQPVTIA